EGRAVIGRHCSSLLRRPPAGKTCLSLTSRAVSSKATEAPFTTRVCPDFAGASDEVTHDETPRHTPVDRTRRSRRKKLDVGTRSCASSNRCARPGLRQHRSERSPASARTQQRLGEPQ